MSALQMHRMMGGSYKTAWFMMHRIREAMREGKLPGGLGGQNKVVEADETYVGGKARNRKNKVPAKTTVLSLVERDGKVRSSAMPQCQRRRACARSSLANVKPRELSDDRRNHRLTSTLGREFGGHGTVNHLAEEYVRAHFWHTNTVEGYFSILKRGIVGVYHWVSRSAPSSLRRRVRFPLQPSRSPWLHRYAAHRNRRRWHLWQAAHLSAA